MKIFIDTNIFFSAILFPNSNPSLALHKSLFFPYEAITSDYVICELKKVFIKKFPQKEKELNAFLETLLKCITIIKTPKKEINISLRDSFDIPILKAALTAKCTLLLTGDKDFLDANIEKIKVISATNFLLDY